MKLNDKEVLAMQYLAETQGWVPVNNILYEGMMTLLDKLHEEILRRNLEPAYQGIMNKEGLQTKLFPAKVSE